MPRVCPKCHFESPVDSPFCPACGAAMNQAEQQRRSMNEYSNAAVLPMKWHNFLIYFSLPLSLALLVFVLLSSWPDVAGADFSLVREDIRSYVRLALYLGTAAQAAALPLILFTEINLVRKRWRGVRGLLFLYAFQAVAAAVTVYLFHRAGAGVPTDVALSIVEETALFFLNRVYYRKRRPIFDPVPRQFPS